jgi:small subunit ribosomal protein S13
MKEGRHRPRRAKDLTEEELAKIIGIIDRSYLVEGALRRQIQPEHRPGCATSRASAATGNRRSLPTRGQRTRSNRPHRKARARPVAGRRA